MAKEITASKFKKNISLSIIAQILSMCVSFVLNLILPKYISEENYAYWQNFLLYASYVGVLHFGMLDGLILRYSQYDYMELDKGKIASQFRMLLSFLSLFCAVCIFVSVWITNQKYGWTLFYLGLVIISRNIFTYNSYLLQLTNRISKYVAIVIGQRVLFGFAVICLLLCGIEDFRYFCIADIAGDLLGCVIGFFYNKGLFFTKGISVKDAISEFRENCSSGINILIATWASILILGSARMVIQWNWGMLTFGKVSFSFSMNGLVLTLITAISVVFFPSIKRMDPQKLPSLYKRIRDVLSPVLIIILILYYPGCYILKIWLPKYTESIVYIGMTLPIIVYTSKVNLLTNNYLKAYREERMLLYLNVGTLMAGVLGYVLFAYLLKSLYGVILWGVFVVAMRSIVSEICVGKYTNHYFYKENIVEVAMTVAFIALTLTMEPLYGIICYCILCTLYLTWVYKTRRLRLLIW